MVGGVGWQEGHGQHRGAGEGIGDMALRDRQVLDLDDRLVSEGKLSSEKEQ